MLSVAEPSRSQGVFVSSSGTGAGKTIVSRALIRALLRRGLRVAGLKPIETGCAPSPLDATALARAAADLRLADDPAWYRAAPPLAPYAAHLSAAAPLPDLPAIVAATRHVEREYDFVLVEGAGGLLVPLDAERSIADLAGWIGYPLLLVIENRLGALSHALTAYEVARSRQLQVAAIALNCSAPAPPDASVETNRRILSARMPCPVLEFPYAADEDDALAQAAERAGLPGVFGTRA